MKLDLRYRSFDVNDIFTQRLNYQRHKKKLKQLNGGTSFNIFPSRAQQIQRYKHNKHNTFLKEMKDRSDSINRSNLKIFEKLAGTAQCSYPTTPLLNRPTEHSNIVDHSSVQLPATARTSSNIRKRKIDVERQHENQRMQIRLRSLVSSINTRKISDEYRKSLQIRNRIMRYEMNPSTNKITPKAEKYINLRNSTNSVKSDGRYSSNSQRLIIKKKDEVSQTAEAEAKLAQTLKQKQQRIDKARNSLAQRRRLRQNNLSSFSRYGQPIELKEPSRQGLLSRQQQTSESEGLVFPTEPKASKV